MINNYSNPNIIQNFKDEIYFNGRKNLIARCINNLIENSLKYAKKVEISMEKQKDNLMIMVSDDGPGVPEKEHALFLVLLDHHLIPLSLDCPFAFPYLFQLFLHILENFLLNYLYILQ